MAAHAPNRILAGILFMCAAASLFATMNGLVKWLTSYFDSMQIVWARTLGHLILVLVLFMPKRGIGILRSNQLSAQLTRSVLLLGSTICAFTALRFITLADSATVSFTAPLLVTMLAVPMLGERLSARRLGAVIAGFVGVLIVIRPGSSVFQWGSLLMLGASLFYALYQLYTRRVSSTDAPETSVVYSALVGTVVMSAIVPFFWTTPQRVTETLVLASTGIFGGVGHYCVARALAYAPANIVSPFNYAQLVVAVLVGFLLFGDLPTVYTWIGAAIIIASGLFVGWTESRRRF